MNNGRLKFKQYLRSEIKRAKVNFKDVNLLLGLKGNSCSFCSNSSNRIPSKEQYLRLQLCLNAVYEDLATIKQCCKLSNTELYKLVSNCPKCNILPLSYEEAVTKNGAWCIFSKPLLLKFCECYMTYIKPRATLGEICDYITSKGLGSTIDISTYRMIGLLRKSGKFDIDDTVKPSRWYLKTQYFIENGTTFAQIGEEKIAVL